MERLKVMIPVDFSETSRRALAWAFDYAARAPCELHLVHVVEEYPLAALPEAPKARVIREMSEVLAEAGDELLRMVPDPDDRSELGPIVPHVSHGQPAKEILRIAEKIGAEMIVMGTHGYSGLDMLLMGSVAEKVVRGARCPVVCVKPGAALAA